MVYVLIEGGYNGSALQVLLKGVLEVYAMTAVLKCIPLGSMFCCLQEPTHMIRSFRQLVGVMFVWIFLYSRGISLLGGSHQSTRGVEEEAVAAGNNRGEGEGSVGD
jgi:hypothetical protein